MIAISCERWHQVNPRTTVGCNSTEDEKVEKLVDAIEELKRQLDIPLTIKEVLSDYVKFQVRLQLSMSRDCILYEFSVFSIRRSGMSHMTATRTYNAHANHGLTKASGIAIA